MMVELKRMNKDNDPIVEIQKFKNVIMRYNEALNYTNIENCKSMEWIQKLEEVMQKKMTELCSVLVQKYEYQFP